MALILFIAEVRSEPMERILVSIDGQGNSLGAVYRAIHLAIRIKATICILEIAPSDRSFTEAAGNASNTKTGEILDSMIEMARSEGVPVNRYLTRGDYMEELVGFVKQKNITLLVLGFPEKESDTSQGLALSMLDEIIKQVKCPVELVHQKVPLFVNGKAHETNSR